MKFISIEKDEILIGDMAKLYCKVFEKTNFNEMIERMNRHIEYTGFKGIVAINDENFLLPIITCGKYFNEGNKVMLPVSLQVHHSVCDGYDASQFIEDLQQLSNTCNEWLK